MDLEKREALERTYKAVIQIGWHDRTLEDLERHFAPDFMIYGTGIDEKSTSAQGFREMIARQRQQSSDLKVHFDIQPVARLVSENELSATFIDEITITFANEDELRLVVRHSVILEYVDDRWRAAHIHASLPTDMQAEGDAWPIEAMKLRNAELEKIVAEKTEHLERSVRSLAVEASFERVRGKALGIRNPDDVLGVCESLLEELRILGLNDILCTQILIFSDTNMSYRNYEYSDDGTHAITEVEYANRPVIHDFVKDFREAGDAFSVKALRGETLEAWRTFRREVYDVQDPELDRAKEVYYHFYSLGKMVLGILTYTPLDHGKTEILRRFRSGFDLVYRMYGDVTLAQTQAREAQIEAALERVRNRTMGMQKSAELKEAIQVVYDQFVQLNIHIAHAGFILDYQARDDMHIWLADKHEVPAEIVIPYFDCAHWNSFLEAKAKGLDFFANHLSFEEKNKFYRDLFAFIPGVPKETADYYFTCRGLAISTVLLENVGLYIENFEGIPYSDEENRILMRIGKVFQQTYTRFLDLQKAEAQAREAQIEAALERVRASTMAMQRSEQLPETSAVMFKQLRSLGQSTDRLTIGISNEKDGYFELWSTDQGGNQLAQKFRARFDERTTVSKIYQAWKAGEDHIVVEQEGDDLVEWLEFVRNEMRMEVKESHVKGRRTQTPAFFSKGFLLLTSLDPPPDPVINILIRFAGVFDQMYTRFLDLQRAEGQAREAQIEVALERVRARAMAMHHPGELSEVLTLLFEQLDQLGVKTAWTHLTLIDLEKNTFTYRMTGREGKRVTAEQVVDID